MPQQPSNPTAQVGARSRKVASDPANRQGETQRTEGPAGVARRIRMLGPMEARRDCCFEQKMSWNHVFAVVVGPKYFEVFEPLETQVQGFWNP